MAIVWGAGGPPPRWFEALVVVAWAIIGTWAIVGWLLEG